MLEVIVFEGAQNLPLFAAQKQGFFAERGVDVNVQFTPNSWVLRDGLAEGRYRIAYTSQRQFAISSSIPRSDTSRATGDPPVPFG